MAQVIIRNPNDIIKILDARVSQALRMTQDEIYKAIMTELNNYYHEPVFHGGSSIPVVYKRLYKMLNSIVKTDIVRSGDSFNCTVGVDEGYLNYTYPGGATGQEVWGWANANTHGGTVDGNLEVWNNAMDNLGGENGIINLMKQNLIKCGVPVI